MEKDELTEKDLYCIAMTLQAEVFSGVEFNIEGRQECILCKYYDECYIFELDGIKKHRQGFTNVLQKLQYKTGVYLGFENR